MRLLRILYALCACLLLSHCGDDRGRGSVFIAANPTQLIANAGADQVTTDSDNNGSEHVTLSANGSNGIIITYSWALNGTVLASTETATVSLPVGTHNIVLTIQDGRAVSTDTVSITINAPIINTNPVANAGPDQLLIDADYNNQENVTLDGSASSDADGDPLTYIWRLNGVVIANGVTPNYNFGIGDHSVLLTVEDGNGGSDTDTVIITVNRPVNSDPELSVPTDSTETSAVINVVASATDRDGDAVSIIWSLNPNGAAQQVIITDPEQDGSAQIQFPRNGIYVFTISADDGNGGTSSDTVTITINAPGAFNIHGHIADGPAGAQTPTADLELQLHWNILAGAHTLIVNTSTDVSGDFTFNDLIGSQADFFVIVPRN